jgi:hypothetical protein
MTPNQQPTGASPAAGSTRRSGRLILGGVVVLVGLLVAAAALWTAGTQRRADNVASFARAPIGCDTTLDFERSGTFLLFVETTGRIDELGGRCNAVLDYDRAADEVLADVIAPGLSLSGPDGARLDILEAPGVSYAVDGFSGTATWSVDIETPGDHVLSVMPIGGEPMAIAVGRSVDEGVGVLRWSAVAAAITALIVGGGLIIAGSRRAPTPDEPSAPWVPDAPTWPSSPPGFPVPPPTTGAVGPPQQAPGSADAAETPPSGATAPPPTPAMPPSTSPWGPPGTSSGTQ